MSEFVALFGGVGPESSRLAGFVRDVAPVRRITWRGFRTPFRWHPEVTCFTCGMRVSSASAASFTASFDRAASAAFAASVPDEAESAGVATGFDRPLLPSSASVAPDRRGPSLTGKSSDGCESP